MSGDKGKAGSRSGVKVKICGLSREAEVEAAAAAGASYVGFVFFPGSPRHVGAEQAGRLSRSAPAGLRKVALLVDPSDREIDGILSAVPVDILQLHGTETPERVAAVRERFGLPVMKAVGVRERNDLDEVERHAETANLLLVDAKPPKGASRPGGLGTPFDWTLIAGAGWRFQWMLAGGLDSGNVAEAVRVTGASQVDASTGVESAPGVKSVRKIKQFVAAAAGA